MTTTVEKTALRWSSVRACPRKAVLEATVPADREWTDQERRIMFRGKDIGRSFVLMLAAGQGAKVRVDSGPTHWVPLEMLAGDGDPYGFVAELRVPWELGVGHADCYAVETDTVIEVLSSASSTHAHSKLLQACGYARTLPDAKAICLAIVNPADLSDDRIVVVKGTDRWDELEAEVEERLSQLRAWRDGEGLPARVCSKPGQARGLFCRHAETCFAGWEPEPVDEITDPDAVDLAVRFYAAKVEEQAAAARLNEVKTLRSEIQAELEQLDLRPGETQFGPYRVKRIHYAGRRSFNLALAEKDSRFHTDLLGEFVKVGEPYDVYQVEKTGSGVIDYGDEVPF